MKTKKITFIRKFKNGLELYNCGRGDWRIQHPEDKKMREYFGSEKRAVDYANNLTGDWHEVVCYFDDEDGEVVFGKEFVKKNQDKLTKEESLRRFKIEETTLLQQKIDELKKEMQEIKAIKL